MLCLKESHRSWVLVLILHILFTQLYVVVWYQLSYRGKCDSSPYLQKRFCGENKMLLESEVLWEYNLYRFKIVRVREWSSVKHHARSCCARRINCDLCRHTGTDLPNSGSLGLESHLVSHSGLVCVVVDHAEHCQRLSWDLKRCPVYITRSNMVYNFIFNT